MIFGPSTQYTNLNLPIVINGIKIQKFDDKCNPKFLGICLDNDLSWKSHITQIYKILSKSLYIMNRVKNVFPHNILKTIYYTLFDSYINYGLLLWGNSSQINKIFKLQKRALRIINCKSFRSHTDPLFRKDEILKINDAYQMQILLFMYDLKTKSLPKSFNNFAVLNRDINARVTRQNNLYHTPRPRTKFSSKLPNHVFPRLWNEFNDIISVLNFERRKQFKNSLRKHFITHYADSVSCTNMFCRDCHS